MKNIVGRTTRIDIPELNLFGQQSKVDTGAWSSSLHAEDIAVSELNGQKILSFRPISLDYPLFKSPDFEVKTVKSSFGDVEERYCVYLTVKREGRVERTLFNLTNRSSLRNQILLGRLFLKKFGLLVDVTKKARTLEDSK